MIGLGIVALAFAGSADEPNSPSLVIEGGPTFHLGASESTGVYDRHSWTIRNEGRSPLKLRTHFTSGRCGFSLWLGREQVIAPGEAGIVWLTWPTPFHQPSSFAHHAEVWTSDPDQPKLRFKVEGRTGLTP